MFASHIKRLAARNSTKRARKNLVSNGKPFDFGNSDKANPLHLMPGPRGLKNIPYIGTMLMFQPFSKYTPQTFGFLVDAFHEKYGNVFKIRVGKDYSVVTDVPQDMEAIFRNEDRYPQRRLMMLSKIYRERNGLPQALGTVSGPEWHELRSALNPLLTKPQVCLSYIPPQNEVANDFVKRLCEMKMTAEEQSEEFFKFAAESIGVLCFNRRLGFFEDDFQKRHDLQSLIDAFKTTLHCTYLSMIGLERKYLVSEKDPFYLKYESAMKLIRHKSTEYVSDVSQNIERCNERENAVESEVNLLVSMIKSSKLNLEKILAIIDSLLIAGTDSTARNLVILFYNLAKNPEKQQKAAEEVLSIIGPDGDVTPEALGKMHYVKACVRESMRLHFPLTLGTERTLTKDVVISGYLVPKGHSVILSSRRSSLDPLNFENPFSFIPERWRRTVQKEESMSTLKKDLSHQTSRSTSSAFACLPFGHGARGCIGRRFAELEMHVSIAKVLQTLTVKVDENYPGLELIYTPFITPTKPIPFIFEKRSWP